MRTREGNYYTETHRECTSCGTMFERKGKDTMRICSSCNTERVKSRSPEYKMLNAARVRSRARGLECSISVADIDIPKECPILGIPLKVHSGSSGGRAASPSLDRIDNSLGYIPGNVWVISRLANSMKASATDEQLLTFSKYWINRLGGTNDSTLT